MEPQPAFIDHITYGKDGYAAAKGALDVCKHNLKAALSAFNNPPVKLGTHSDYTLTLQPLAALLLSIERYYFILH